MAGRGYITEKNPSVIRMLAARSAGRNRGRNLILFLAVFLGMVTLAMVFGISGGKIQAEYLRAVRRAGTAASTILERGTQSQYEKICTLDYIEKAGRKAVAGQAYAGEENVCEIAALDRTAWEDMMKPAYTGITGHYPRKENEIMLPQRTLESLGIAAPEEGMEISLTVETGLFEKREETFLLSGWYEDYTEPVSHPAQGYVTEGKLTMWGRDMQESGDILIIQKDSLDGAAAEEKLYEDVRMSGDSQTFAGGNTYGYEAVNQFLGGYGLAAWAAVLVLAAVWSLIRNVLQISMTGDVRQMGLLHTLGATRKQLRGFYFRQTGLISLGGILLGAVFSAVLLLTVIPHILGEQYLSQYGGQAGLTVFRPALLGEAAFFLGLVTAAASAGVVMRTVEMSCLEALHYTGTRHGKTATHKPHREKRFREGREIRSMAWRRLLRTPGRLAWTTLSLFLGLVTALGAVVISEGTDYTHALEKKPDFVIAGRFASWAEEEGWGVEYLGREPGEDPFQTEGTMLGLLYDNEYAEFSPISMEAKEELLKPENSRPDHVAITEGAYAKAYFTPTGIRPFVEDSSTADVEQMLIETDGCTIQILTDRQMEALKKFARNQSLTVDMESLENGSGVLLLQDHVLSPSKLKQADKAVGEPVWFTPLPTKEERDRLAQQAAEEAAGENTGEDSRGAAGENTGADRRKMTLCGYVDTGLDGFPDLKRTWHGPRIIYFVISEKGFEKLQMDRAAFKMEIDVENGEEEQAGQNIQRILSGENRIRKKNMETGIFQISRQELLEEAQGYVKGSRVILGALSAVLTLAGLMNYFNVMAAGIFTRKREFALLESVGMTRRQQRRMLSWEGFGYFMLTVLLLIIVGVPGLWALAIYMEERLNYFVFTWPVIPAAVMLVILLILCVSLPGIIGRRNCR